MKQISITVQYADSHFIFLYLFFFTIGFYFFYKINLIVFTIVMLITLAVKYDLISTKYTNLLSILVAYKAIVTEQIRLRVTNKYDNYVEIKDEKLIKNKEEILKETAIKYFTQKKVNKLEIEKYIQRINAEIGFTDIRSLLLSILLLENEGKKEDYNAFLEEQRLIKKACKNIFGKEYEKVLAEWDQIL